MFCVLGRLVAAEGETNQRHHDYEGGANSVNVAGKCVIAAGGRENKTQLRSVREGLQEVYPHACAGNETFPGT